MRYLNRTVNSFFNSAFCVLDKWLRILRQHLEERIFIY
jgi:hypothetical protein